MKIQFGLEVFITIAGDIFTLKKPYKEYLVSNLGLSSLNFICGLFLIQKIRNVVSNW